MSMGVYIKGMEMPTRGHTVTLTIMGGGEAVVQYYDCKPQLTVPIVYKNVPVHEHGRLIDADALYEHVAPCADQFTLRAILRVPTIIPADKEGEE